MKTIMQMTRTTRITALALCVFSVLTSGVAWGEEDWTWDPHANAEVDTTGYFYSLAPTNQILETGQLTLPTVIRYQRSFKIKLAPTFKADPLNNSVAERYWVDLPEG